MNNGLLLDTHCWIWFELGHKGGFSPDALKLIETAAANGRLMLSAISVWELGMLEAKGRIRLTMPCLEWVRLALETPGLALEPLTPEIAIESSRLPGNLHGDPADRILIATCRQLKVRLLTGDSRILEYGAAGFIEAVPAR